MSVVRFEVDMNFNHLVPKTELITKCINSKKHYFIPTRHIEASLGQHVAVRFRCKHCDRLVVSFLTNEEFAVHGKIIENYGG